MRFLCTHDLFTTSPARFTPYTLQQRLTDPHAVAMPAVKLQRRKNVQVQGDIHVEEYNNCPFPLMDLPEEVLLRVLEALPAQQLLSVSRVRFLPGTGCMLYSSRW